jgi:hypothetical protein
VIAYYASLAVGILGGAILGFALGAVRRHRCVQCGRRLAPADRSDRLCSANCAVESYRGLRSQIRDARKVASWPTRGRK